MGFQAWSKLSVLVLAAAALVGCNNGPEKNKKLLGATNGQPPPSALSNPNPAAFPTAGANNGNLAPTSGNPAFNRPNTAPFGAPANPAGSPNAIPTPPVFQPLGGTPNSSSSSFAPTGNTNPVVPSSGLGSSTPNLGNTSPSIPLPDTSSFGASRTTLPPSSPPAIPKPNGF